MKTRAGL